MKLTIPGPMPSLNQLIGGKVRDRIRLKKQWLDVVKALANKLPAAVGPVRMRYDFFEFRDGQGRDPLNILAGAAKIIEDALVAIGVLPDDNREVIFGIEMGPIVTDKRNPRVELTITSATPKEE